MSSFLYISSFVLAVLATGIAAYWTVLFIRFLRVLRVTPYLRDGLELPAVDDLVSVIVPAHNEAKVIARLAKSILQQQKAHIELIVVLDRCTDDTRSILEDAAGGDSRLRIIENEDCPSDWAGKCNAARIGAQAAQGRWLLFTDADVHFDPHVVRAGVSLSQANGLGLLSAYTSLTATKWWEWVVQPVAAVALFRQYPLDRVNNRQKPRSFANGQFMLFAADIYAAIGGHECVREDLLEDISFARHVHAGKSSVMVVAADQMLVTSMYASLGTLLEGWKRIFIESNRRNSSKLRQHSIRVIASGLSGPCGILGIVIGSFTMSSGFTLAGELAIISGVCAVFAHLLTLAAVYRFSGFPILGILGWPLGCVLIAGVFFTAGRDIDQSRPIRWGGREYRFSRNGKISMGANS